MIKKSFSLIEIIFTIAIISIILAVSIPKMKDTLFNSNKVKIKNDILQIREAITKYKNKMILQNRLVELEELDDGDEFLFNKILNNPIIASNELKASAWSKVSQNTYKVYINSTNNVEFKYDSTNYTFDCDFENEHCKELSQ